MNGIKRLKGCLGKCSALYLCLVTSYAYLHVSEVATRRCCRKLLATKSGKTFENHVYLLGNIAG